MPPKGGKSGGKGSGKTEVKASVDVSDVRRADKDLARELPAAIDDALRRLGEDAVGKMRRTVRGGPGRDNPGTDSKDRIARGIDYVVRDGKLILSSAPNMQSGRRAFPAAFNKGRWTHPVFGTRARVTQRGVQFWTPRDYEAQAQQMLEQAGQSAAEKIG